MLFNSTSFLCFFPIVVLLYFTIPKKWKNRFLLIASYYFYMCWSVKYILLIFISTVVTYLSGLLMDNIDNSDCEEVNKSKHKKRVVLASFVINLSILFFFKYFLFSIKTVSKVLSLMHIQLHEPTFNIMLPVGISFYTFQALSYTMDVYRGDIYAEKDFFQYALFVSFFPQLVAGPIERSKNLLKQLAVPKPFSFDDAKEGLLLMLWGYFLKIVLADRIAIFVDTVYGDYSQYPGTYLIVATIMFAVQIYCDFSGYSTIAMGAAKVMRIQLMENFNAPYLSVSVAEFWRNWHISLTSWFKDYLYIPLGGSRKGKHREYANKIIVFLVSGLWHGAQSSFVVWGGLNGLYQVVGEMLQPVRDRAVQSLHLNRNSIGHRLINMIGTFIFVDFSWIFFRANGVREALKIIQSMVAVRNPWVLFDGSLYRCGLDEKNFRLAILCILILLFADLCKKRGIVVRRVILEQDYWCRWIIISLTIVFLLVFGKYGPVYDESAFIYFQF